MEVEACRSTRLAQPQRASPLSVRALHCRSLEENEFPHVLSGGMMSSTSVETAGRSSGRCLYCACAHAVGNICVRGLSRLPWLLNGPKAA